MIVIIQVRIQDIGKGGLCTKTCRICVNTRNVFSLLFEVLGSLKSVCVCGGGGGDLDPPLQ